MAGSIPRSVNAKSHERRFSGVPQKDGALDDRPPSVAGRDPQPFDEPRTLAAATNRRIRFQHETPKLGQNPSTLILQTLDYWISLRLSTETK